MKKITVLAAMAAIGLSSCSMNQVTDVVAPSDNVDNIGINTGVGTSRGVDMIGSSLQAHDIILSYTDNDNPTKSGNLTFKYNTTEGKWNDNEAKVKWSDLVLPVSFLSFTDATGDKGNAADYTVSNVDPELHEDLLYMGAAVSAVPAGGKVYSTFKHALSKVDLISVKGANHVTANYIGFKNVISSGSPTLTVSVATNTVIHWATGTTKAHYETLNRKVALSETPNPKQLMDGAIISNDGTATTSETANMKLIPQTIEGDLAGLQATIKGGANKDNIKQEPNFDYSTLDLSDFKYIEVMYRMTGAQNERIVGFENAKNHPDFASQDAATQTAYENKPLFIKAAFVMSNDLILKASYYYQFNINFNSFGGLLMDDHYYDQNGNRTNFEVVADIETGDPIIPSDDTIIGITVLVDEWTTGSDTDME